VCDFEVCGDEERDEHLSEACADDEYSGHVAGDWHDGLQECDGCGEGGGHEEAVDEERDAESYGAVGEVPNEEHADEGADEVHGEHELGRDEETERDGDEATEGECEPEEECEEGAAVLRRQTAAQRERRREGTGGDLTTDVKAQEQRNAKYREVGLVVDAVAVLPGEGEHWRLGRATGGG